MAVLVLSFTSCASLFLGNKAVVHFDSAQQDVDVLVNGKKIGTTPLTLKVRKKLSKQVVEFRKQNCTPEQQKIKKEFVWSSLFSQVFIPIDLMTGAAVNYKKNFYYSDLKCSNDNPIKANKKDRYYIITENMDTLLCNPFIKIKGDDIITHMFTKGPSDVMNENDRGHNEYVMFELLNGSSTSLPLKKVREFKIIEVYSKRFPIIPFKTGTDFLTKHYVLTSYTLNNKSQKPVHMELLLSKGNYRLMKHIIIEEHTYSNFDVTAKRTSTTHSRISHVFYFLFENGNQIAELNNKNCLAMVSKYFSTNSKLITRLKKRPKMEEVERYVYNRKGRLPDRIYYFEETPDYTKYR